MTGLYISCYLQNADAKKTQHLHIASHTVIISSRAIDSRCLYLTLSSMSAFANCVLCITTYIDGHNRNNYGAVFITEKHRRGSRMIREKTTRLGVAIVCNTNAVVC